MNLCVHPVKELRGLGVKRFKSTEFYGLRSRGESMYSPCYLAFHASVSDPAYPASRNDPPITAFFHNSFLHFRDHEKSRSYNLFDYNLHVGFNRVARD